MSQTPPKLIRAGDRVFHRFAKEHWTVAYADYERDELSWCGWPDGMAKISDCDLVESCSDEQHRNMVRRLTEKDIGNRTRQAQRLYPEESKHGG